MTRRNDTTETRCQSCPLGVGREPLPSDAPSDAHISLQIKHFGSVYPLDCGGKMARLHGRTRCAASAGTQNEPFGAQKQTLRPSVCRKRHVSQNQEGRTLIHGSSRNQLFSQFFMCQNVTAPCKTNTTQQKDLLTVCRPLCIARLINHASSYHMQQQLSAFARYLAERLLCCLSAESTTASKTDTSPHIEPANCNVSTRHEVTRTSGQVLAQRVQ